MPDVVLSAKTYDPDAYLAIDLTGDREALIERTRRATVTPTLDGGVVANDGGFSHGDRQWDVRFQPSRAELETLKYLIETYSQLDCVTKEGLFTVVPQKLTMPAPLLAQIRLLVLSKDV